MFGGKNGKANANAKVNGKAAAKTPIQEAIAMERVPARPAVTTPSIIAPGTLILGGIKTAGDIQIDGRIEGDLFAASATLGSESELIGDLFAERAHIRGRVDGNVYAHHVMLATGAQVAGDLSCKTFEVESGAKLEGHCRHPENPLAEAQQRQAAKSARNQAPVFAPPPRMPAPAPASGPSSATAASANGLATAAS